MSRYAPQHQAQAVLLAGMGASRATAGQPPGTATGSARPPAFSTMTCTPAPTRPLFTQGEFARMLRPGSAGRVHASQHFQKGLANASSRMASKVRGSPGARLGRLQA